MTNYAEVYVDAKGEWRWKLRASNGRVIADSGEGYTHETDCLAGLASATSGPPVITSVKKKKQQT